ncbi:MAG: urea carboxylase [Fibrobacteres bacterium]|nr:urea carboxylase [Fibrobacterota bacterium]
MDDDLLIRSETLRGGAMWSWTLKRGTSLRLVDPEGGANVSALFLNADAPLERYNMPDTLKAQFIAFLTKGNVLYSDMGRILCSIVEDTCGWHDTLCGATDAGLTKAKYGDSGYQRHRNDWFRNGRDNFLVELGKYGLGKKDLPVPVNFFSKVTVDGEGNLRWQSGNSGPGSLVELRAEMDTLVVLSNTPHPMDPVSTYSPRPVRLEIRRCPPPGPGDLCRNSRPENGRGFLNTEALYR